MLAIQNIIFSLFGLRDNYNDNGFLKDFHGRLCAIEEKNKHRKWPDKFNGNLNVKPLYILSKT